MQSLKNVVFNSPVELGFAKWIPSSFVAWAFIYFKDFDVYQCHTDLIRLTPRYCP